MFPHPRLKESAKQFRPQSDLAGAPKAEGVPSIGHGDHHGYAVRKSESTGGNEQDDTPPDSPFRGHIGHIHVVDATPANMGQVVFN